MFQEDNYYIVKKLIGDKGKAIAVTGKDGKNRTVVGNFPRLFGGMILNLDLSYNKYTDEKGKQKTSIVAEDYLLELTDRNIKILTKHKVDIGRYTETLKHHREIKSLGYGWLDAKRCAEGDYYGIYSFDKADQLHKAVKNDIVDKERLETIVRKIVRNARKNRRIEYSVEEFFRWFEEIEDSGSYGRLDNDIKSICLVQSGIFRIENGKVYDEEIKKKEDYIKGDIINRRDSAYPILTRSEIKDYLDSIDRTYVADEQAEVLNCLVGSAPCIVTGGAGTGKTSVIDQVIKCYQRYHEGSDAILLVAPTGKAARRLEEKTHFPANTIHKALRKMYSLDEDGEEQYIYYGKDRRLPHKLVIIDESSMIDTELMYDLLCAIDERSKVIFVGDHNQLYPVGYGEPFFDFLNMIAVYHLKENHRQEGDTDILSVAQAILDSKGYVKLAEGKGKGVEVKKIPFDELPNYFGKGKNVQMISPYNGLNDDINSYMKKGKYAFNKGDKIIALRNTEDYSNGEIGVVNEIYDERSIFAGKKDVAENGEHIIVALDVDIEGKQHIIYRKDFADFSLAYSITIHKMQGSESDKVIVFLPAVSDGFVDKRMLYTAVTRARKDLRIYYFEKGGEG